MDKKVLIITYYWPPAGGPGVQRWLKFVKYLPDFGILPIVYIPDNPEYPIIDENLLADVSPKTITIRKKIIEPYGFAGFLSGKKIKKISSGIIPAQRKQSFAEKLALWIRGNIFIPDARILWVKPSVRFLEDYISTNAISTIITSGPPHSLHLIGMELQKRSNIKWIADFRDPWTTIGYHKNLKLTRSSATKHKNLENKVLNSADQIIVTSKTTKTEFAKITNKPISVITNGYDTTLVEKQPPDAKFSLAHIGSLLPDRNPEILWQSLSEILKEVPEFKKDFELKLVGTVSADVLKSIGKYQLNKYVNNLGYVSHDEAIAQQQKSQVLLLIEIDSDETKSIIPGKLFEYMVSGRPIIGIGPTGSDFAEIIQNTNTGIFVDYAEKEKLKNSILEFYSKFSTGELKSNAVGLQQYSRRSLTQDLGNVIERAWES